MCCAKAKISGLLLLIGSGLLAGGFLSGCSFKTANDPWAGSGVKPKVLVSFPPLYSFAAAVAGDDAVVKCLSTSGVHGDADATPTKLDLARGCDVFIVNGLKLEGPIVKKLAQSAGNPKWKVLELGAAMSGKRGWLVAGSCRHNHGDPDADHEHGPDPHVWLSVRHAKNMTESIRDELKALDPTHAEGYERRANEYLLKLDKLEADGLALLKDKKERTIVSFHDSLTYFAKCYDIKIADVIEVNPGVEPSSDKLNELIDICRKEHVRVIAVEPQYPSKTSAKVIRDALRGSKDSIEAEFVEIDPLETCDEKELSADLYEQKMRINLTNLAKVLR